jgi:hypothetical protein
LILRVGDQRGTVTARLAQLADLDGWRGSVAALRPRRTRTMPELASSRPHPCRNFRRQRCGTVTVKADANGRGRANDGGG